MINDHICWIYQIGAGKPIPVLTLFSVIVQEFPAPKGVTIGRTYMHTGINSCESETLKIKLGQRDEIIHPNLIHIVTKIVMKRIRYSKVGIIHCLTSLFRRLFLPPSKFSPKPLSGKSKT